MAAGVGGGYLDRQMGIVVINGRRVAVAMASRPADGSDRTGRANLTAMARRLVSRADVRGVPSVAKC